MSVSGCGCVQWEAVFASRQLFCVSAFDSLVSFLGVWGGKGWSQAVRIEPLVLYDPIFVNTKDCSLEEIQ